MNAGPSAAWLPDGRRLHLQHGPIDVILQAYGADEEVACACRQAVARFATILDELVSELPALRTPLRPPFPALQGTVARRMRDACAPHLALAPELFLTPMAAVAGAVADEVLAALLAGRTLSRAYVNDGGDIALHLSPGQQFQAGVVADLARPEIAATARIDAVMPVRGIATSGRGGRSFSLGIADAVTVLAKDGAAADAAATPIANAVNVDAPGILRRPARTLREDSDLGDLPVVVAVGALSDDDVATALDAGLAEAERMRRQGLIEGAYLYLRGRQRTCGVAVLQNGEEDACARR